MKRNLNRFRFTHCRRCFDRNLPASIVNQQARPHAGVVRVRICAVADVGVGRDGVADLGDVRGERGVVGLLLW